MERAPYVDVVFGPQTLHRLPELLERRRASGRPQVDVSFPEIEKFDHLPPAAWKAPRRSYPSWKGAASTAASASCRTRAAKKCHGRSRGGRRDRRPSRAGRERSDAPRAERERVARRISPERRPDFAELLYYLDELPGWSASATPPRIPREFTQRLIDAHAATRQARAARASAGAVGLGPRARGDEARLYRARVPLDRAPPAPGAARHQPVLGLHRRLPGRDRGRLRGDAQARARRRFRRLVLVRLQPAAGNAGGGAARCGFSVREDRKAAAPAGAARSQARAISEAMVGTTASACWWRALPRKTTPNSQGRTGEQPRGELSRAARAHSYNTWTCASPPPCPLTACGVSSPEGETGRSQAGPGRQPAPRAPVRRARREPAPDRVGARRDDRAPRREVHRGGRAGAARGAGDRAFLRPRLRRPDRRGRAARPDRSCPKAHLTEDEGPQLLTRRADLHGRTPHQVEYIENILAHDLTFGIGPAGTGKTYLAVACAVDALERDKVKRIVLVRPGGRGGRAPRLPARRPRAEGRSLSAAAVRRALRPDGLREDRQAPRARHDRARAARLHARPHAQPRVHHPRRGAEHHARADEDVPDAHRLRREGGGERRRHPDRPRARPEERPDRGAPHPRRRARHRVHAVRRAGRGAPPAGRAHHRCLRLARSRKNSVSVQYAVPRRGVPARRGFCASGRAAASPSRSP